VTPTLSAMALIALLAAPANGSESRLVILQLEDQWRVAQERPGRLGGPSLRGSDFHRYIGVAARPS
jgi:hypothetical protein